MSQEKIREAVEALLENFWVTKEGQSNAYYLVREHENFLRSYFSEKFNYSLTVNRYFARLEKIPAEVEDWMQVAEFKASRDYAFLCSLLAFLEKKGVDEMFIFAHLLEEVKAIYPEDIRWENYDHRKSLIRAIKFANKMGIIKVIDGSVSDFGGNEKNIRVLYQNTVLSRYFLRVIHNDLYRFTLDDMLEGKHDDNEFSAELKRSHKVYRKLFITPSVHREECKNDEFEYIVRYRERLKNDVEQTTGYRFELFNNQAFLTTDQNKMIRTLYVSEKAISDIALHFGSLIREKYLAKQLVPNNKGNIELTIHQFRDLVLECKGLFGRGWGADYRDDKKGIIVKDLLAYLKEWKMLRVTEDDSMVILYPSIVRTVGKYPKDFDGEVVYATTMASR